MTRDYRHGLVIGKFYPPHEGHHLLVREAAARAERVTVVVMGAGVETVPLAERVTWMRQVHADTANVTVTGIRCDIPVDLGSDAVWAAQVALMAAAVRQVTDDPMDAVFSSEPYGDVLARRFGATHVQRGPCAGRRPDSGSAVRATSPPAGRTSAPVVQSRLAVRVVSSAPSPPAPPRSELGTAAEPTGAGAGSGHDRRVGEYGREYTVGQVGGPGPGPVGRRPAPAMADLGGRPRTSRPSPRSWPDRERRGRGGLARAGVRHRRLRHAIWE